LLTFVKSRHGAVQRIDALPQFFTFWPGPERYSLNLEEHQAESWRESNRLQHLASERSTMSSSPARKPDIFAFAPNAWRGPWMNRQQILSRLARRGWPVTYSTGPLTSWERRTERWRNAPLLSTYEMHDGVRVEVAGKSRLRWPRVAPYDRLVMRRHASALLHQAGCAPSEAIAYVFHPGLHDVAAAMNCRWIVYHAYDVFALQPGWSDALAQAQDELLERADLVVASSPSVAGALRDPGADRVLILPNGADAQAFAAGALQPCPADLAAIPRPRIAYVGHLNRKVDFAMIATVAKARPDWHWVLVGPVAERGSGAPTEDPQIAVAFHECQALANVHFLGSKPYTALPAYAAHMDVNTISYRADRGWWNAAAPLKLHEYLATGRPVVSVDLPDIRAFADVVRFARDRTGWIDALEAALNERSAQMTERRRRVARANSWDDRVDLLEHHLGMMVTQGESVAARSIAS
jgi:glycosyltransferase involved in cell wall biosynthesis